VGALAQFWVMGSNLEGRVWTTRALARGRSAPPLVLAKALEGGATLAFLQGDHAAAALLAREEVEFARKTQDRWRLAYALGHRAVLVLFGGEVEEAEACMQEAMPLSEATGDQWLIGHHLSNLGLIAWTRSDYQTACSMLRQSVEISRALNDVWFLGIALGNLAYVTLCVEGGEEARALHREGLLLFHHLGDRAGIGANLVGIAGVEAKQDRADRAARLLGAAAAILETEGLPLPLLHQREHIRIQQQTQARLGDEIFSLARAEGRAMTIEQAVAFALEACEP
jgi:non-specific serine/threonine protein kinase